MVRGEVNIRLVIRRRAQYFGPSDAGFETASNGGGGGEASATNVKVGCCTPAMTSMCLYVYMEKFQLNVYSTLLRERAHIIRLL